MNHQEKRAYQKIQTNSLYGKQRGEFDGLVQIWKPKEKRFKMGMLIGFVVGGIFGFLIGYFVAGFYP
jgi:hypothetical protein